jgi:hypothetical protein
MKKYLGILALLLCVSPAWAAAARLYPGASLDSVENGHFQTMKAKSTPGLQTQMGQQTFYTTADSFEKVYAFYKKLYPETDVKIKKNKVPLAGGAKLSEAFFCVDGAHSVGRSKNWLKIQRPLISSVTAPGGKYEPKIENVTVITVTVK